MTIETPTKETTPLAVGAEAPDFTLQDQDQKEFKLSKFRGKNVILLFYPLDWSPTCTTENVCFTTDLSRFAEYGEVAAISIDSTYSHKAWVDALKLKHRLLSDMHRKVCKAYGLYFPDANISQRATVIVDKNGKVSFVRVNENITAERDYDEVESFLKSQKG